MPFFTRASEPSPEENAPSGAVPFNTPRSLVASAARVDLKSTKELEAVARRRLVGRWQTDAWEYYDLIGELKFAATILANVLSRVNIYAAYIADSSQVPARVQVIDHLDEEFKEKASSMLYLLETGNGGTAGLLRSAALNLFVAGECYLVREPAKWTTGEPEKYQIRSIDEIVATPALKKRGRGNAAPKSGWSIKPSRDAKQDEYIEIPENGYIARLWRPHPRFSDEAESSIKGVLDLCDELLLMSRTASAVAKSRLSSGVFFVPDGLSYAAQSDGEMLDPNDPNAAPDNEDDFEEQLIDAMVTPISDPSSASAVVPLLVRGPEDLGAKMLHMSFARTWDPQLAKHMETVLNRIISGIDLPKEIVGGMANLKGANAKIVEETMYNSHIEPMILMLCDMLTVAFLRPALRALGFPEEHIMRTVIWYDPSAVTAKPSKSESATLGFDKQIISADAWRRAHGFSISDAPTQLEIAQRLAVSKGLISEPLAEKLISTLIPDLMADLRKEQLQQSDPTSAATLNDALSGDTPPVPDAAPGETPAESAPAEPESGTIDTSTPPPSTLLEP
jgi:hypothetical protein